MSGVGLGDLHREEGYPAIKNLAEKAGVSPLYLLQLARGWKGRRPSVQMADKLVAADDRLSFEKLVRGERNDATMAN
jgi:hypothetical protein